MHSGVNLHLAKEKPRLFGLVSVHLVLFFSVKVEQSILFSTFTPRVGRPWRALPLSPWRPLLGTDNLGQQGALD